MATTSFTQLSLRQSGNSKGFLRNALDRVIEARERQARRYIAQHHSIHGFDDFGASAHESLFDGQAPERR